jgi:flagellin
MTVNTNTDALYTQQALTMNNRRLTKAIEQLSTGSRINSAGDDAAGLAISSQMTTQIRGLNQAVRNANDGISMLQTADGAAQTLTDMLIRMRELAVQSANGSNSGDERAALNSEFGELKKELNNITQNTTWNGRGILDGSVATVKFQVGAGDQQAITTAFKNFSTSVIGLHVTSGMEILSASSATTAMGAITQAITAVDQARSQFGAKMNRLTYAADNAANAALQQSASRSRVLDADYAKVTSEMARAQIIEQAGTAMLSQANQMPRLVLALLR